MVCVTPNEAAVLLKTPAYSRRSLWHMNLVTSTLCDTSNQHVHSVRSLTRVYRIIGVLGGVTEVTAT